jgi:hypothetical protein
MRVKNKKQIEMEERRKKVAANILAGLNYRDIAEALGVTIGTISRDFKVIIGRLQKEQTPIAEQIVSLEIRRLDRALNAIYEKVQSGDQNSIDTMLKIMNQRAKYLGLYAPDKQELSGELEIKDASDVISKLLSKPPAQ